MSMRFEKALFHMRLGRKVFCRSWDEPKYVTYSYVNKQFINNRGEVVKITPEEMIKQKWSIYNGIQN